MDNYKLINIEIDKMNLYNNKIDFIFKLQISNIQL